MLPDIEKISANIVALSASEGAMTLTSQEVAPILPDANVEMAPPPIQQTRLVSLREQVIVQIGGNAFIFSTWLGGSGSDSGNGVTFDNIGNILPPGKQLRRTFPRRVHFKSRIVADRTPSPRNTPPQAPSYSAPALADRAMTGRHRLRPILPMRCTLPAPRIPPTFQC